MRLMGLLLISFRNNLLTAYSMLFNVIVGNNVWPAEGVYVKAGYVGS